MTSDIFLAALCAFRRRPRLFALRRRSLVRLRRSRLLATRRPLASGTYGPGPGGRIASQRRRAGQL
jgi:hypothetical protein